MGRGGSWIDNGYDDVFLFASFGFVLLVAFFLHQRTRTPQVRSRNIERTAGMKRFLLVLASALFFLIASLPLLAVESQNLVEIDKGWKLTFAENVQAQGAQVSKGDFDASGWYPVKHMPSTVLQALEDAGVYKNLYFGMNLGKVPELWNKDWWYRTTFSAPPGRSVYTLIFKGINYRAEIWLNGHELARSSQAVGMYNEIELEATPYIVTGGENILAVKITPERPILGEGTVELADSWHDWINWKYLGADTPPTTGVSFVPDRNAGVWKRVYLSSSGPVTIRHPYVVTDLPLPETNPASLTVYVDLTNHAYKPVVGILTGEITRPGRESVGFEQPVSLLTSETKEVSFSPQSFAALIIHNPELWWPYRWGKPNLYHLQLQFRVNDEISDSEGIDFGIRKVTQKRDTDVSYPKIGTGGSFYLQVNGKDYLIRGAVYTPDLLFINDPTRDAAIMLYAKDLGLNMLRWELKIADDTMIDRADREGMPVMLGWMCCGQWEQWDSWTAEDQWVARTSLRARLRELRSHPSVVLWANGSDGLPPDPVLNDYHSIEGE